MSIEGPKNVPGNGNPGGTEELTEEQKKKAAEDKAKADAAQTDADIQDGLNGKKSGTPASNNAGSSQTTVGGGLQGSGGFGYGGIFGNTTLNVDQQQLNDLTNKLLNFTMSAGSLPFGLGQSAMQNSIGAWFQAIMNCFQFTNTTTTVSGGTSATIAASSGTTTLIDTNKVPEGYTQTAKAGVFSKDGKFYKYENFKIVECKEDGSALTEAAPADSNPADSSPAPASTEPETPATPTKPSSPKKETTKSEAKPASASSISQKDEDYQTYGNGNICKKKGDASGARYVKHNGQWVKIDKWGENGVYTIGNSIYNSNGVTTGQNKRSFNAILSSFTSKSSMDTNALINNSKNLDKNTVLSNLSGLDKNKYNISTNSNGSISITDKSSNKLVCTFNFNSDGKIKSVENSGNSGRVGVDYKYGSNGKLAEASATNSYGVTSINTKVTYNADGSTTTSNNRWVQRGTQGGSWVADKISVTNKHYSGTSYDTNRPKTLAAASGGTIPKIDANVAGYSTQGGEHISLNGGSLYKETNGSYRFVKGGTTWYYDKSGNCTKRVVSTSEDTKTYTYQDKKYSVTTEIKRK